MWDLCNFISSNFPAKTNQLLSRDSYDNNRNQVKKERGDVKEYFESIKRRDPAARNIIQIILLYPGVQAVFWYRIAHFLYIHHLKFIAELMMFIVRCCLNIEIHPAAQIGKRLFIDHGTGVVIGATSIIGDDVTMYHGVTLGGVGRGDVTGKRHPTVESNVTIGTCAKILGNITLGKGCIIGANAVVLKDVPPSKTSVGVPSIVKK